MANNITSEAYADLMIENVGIDESINPENITFINERLSLLNIPINNINKCAIETYPYRYFPKCYTLQSITSLEKSGVTRIQNNPNLNLYGQGVLIGIIDTGIDYQHEAFLNPDRTTKIVSLWDQTIEGESLSENITYGSEYDQETINLALKSNDPTAIVPSKDDIGHGTMIAGIISGNESLANNFRGVVPRSELVVVKLKQAKKITRDIFSISHDVNCYQETDIMFAVNYVIEISRQLNRPLVICIALGTSQGGHDGRGALDNYLSYLNDIGRVAIVIAAGNEGNTRRHYLGVIDSLSAINDFELNVGDNEFGFSMELWQSTPHRLSIDIRSPAGEYINPIFPGQNECRRISFIFETTIVYVNNILSESETGDQLILIRFEYPTQGIWRFRITNLDSLTSFFNIWLPSGNLISENTYFLNANPNTTITGPGNSFAPITITAYDHINDSIWLGSSRGYTRTDMIKPDLAAPGVNLTCPLINNSYGTTTGTGAATAHATGIVAMIMEWGVVKGNYPNIYGPEIKQILIRGAKRESDINYPNRIWGYGIIDIFEGFNRLS